MAWVKRNLLFVIGAAVVLGLIGFAAFHIFPGETRNAGRDKLIQANQTIAPLADSVPNSRVRQAGAVAADQTSGATEIKKITLRCRAVDRKDVSPASDVIVAYALKRELEAGPLFDAETTKLGPHIKIEPETDTFTFDVTLTLKRPIKL